MATIFVVFAGRHDHEQPAAAFSEESAATAYALRQTNLERQRHPHAATTWQVKPIDVDALA